MNQFVCELDKGVAFTQPGEGSLLDKYSRKCPKPTMYLEKYIMSPNYPNDYPNNYEEVLLSSVIFNFHECHVIDICNYLI